jgi:tetratricopeptide (TPR) repeat protein
VVFFLHREERAMTVRAVLISATALLIAAPAAASITVVGGSLARSCYLAAESQVAPTWDDFEACDRALADGLNRRDTVATHVNRGVLRLRRGDVNGALRDFDTATALDPREAEAYLNRGVALLRNDRAAEALPNFDAALARRTRRPAFAFYGRAGAHEELGNIRAAYADYRRASELEPRWAPPRQELARFRVRD